MLGKSGIEKFKSERDKLSSEIKEFTDPEGETCRKLITPILYDLGWRERDGNIKINKKSRDGSIPDYKLLDNEKKTIVLVEAKKLGIKQLPKYIKQLRGYEKDEENIELLVLTDGNVWKFYLPSRLKGYKDLYYDVELNADNFREDLNKLLDHESVLSCQSGRYLKILFHLDRIKKEYESIKSLPESHEQLEEDADVVSRKMEDIGFDLTSKKFRQTVAKKLDEAKQVGVKKQTMPRPGPKTKRGKPKQLQVEYGKIIFKGNALETTVITGQVLAAFADAEGIEKVAKKSIDKKKKKKVPIVMASADVGRYIKRRADERTEGLPGYSDGYVYLTNLSSDDNAKRLNLLAKALKIDKQVKVYLNGELIISRQ